MQQLRALRTIHDVNHRRAALGNNENIRSLVAQDSPGTVPVTRQNKWAGTVFLPAKKPMVVFASDDMSSKRQLQLELTATPIK